VTVDPRSDRAIYRQVADILRAQIADGTLPPGSMLPSEKQLADGLGVGRDAVRQAIAHLRLEGALSTIKGRGSVVRTEPQRRPVALSNGATAVARMPSDRERSALSLDEGVPVLVVTALDGAVVVHAADEIILTSSPL
jgi:DNA-binding FadR family transcriptional regulator